MGSFSLLSAAARRLEGKVAVITGGASGIGECTAKLFCQHGAKVVIADVQEKKGLSLCNEIGTDKASYVHCDVTDESHVKTAVDSAVSIYGKLDIMFNNAGIGGQDFRVMDACASSFERVVAVNLKGSFLGTKHAARVMVPRNSGSIIYTSSLAGIVGGNFGYAYTSSKHALTGLAKEAAVELGQHGIRVNCISPFMVATPMVVKGLSMKDTNEVEDVSLANAILKGEPIKVDDVANVALFLASEDSRYVSGHNVPVDGGFNTSSKFKFSI